MLNDKKDQRMILAGDIGGTKTNLALYKKNEGKLSVYFQCQFSSRDFSSFSDVIAAFGKKVSFSSLEAACFGIAGPVVEGNCQTTNLPWDISSSLIQEQLNISKICLLNDLEATAYGMLHLKDDEFVELNPGKGFCDANRAVIAAGTGLGEAMLYYDGKEYHPVGSEGGHSDFAPATPQQDELLKWLRLHYTEHVSFERVLSGPGIYMLYKFLLENGFAPEPDKMLFLEEDIDKSAMISECALQNSDPLCMETLRLFTEIYGAEAGNLALKTMSLGGVYIGGGIAPKILPIMQQNVFMNSFVRKGRFEELLKGMQVKIALNDETALLGAGYFAANKL